MAIDIDVVILSRLVSVPTGHHTRIKNTFRYPTRTLLGMRVAILAWGSCILAFLTHFK